MAAAQPGDAQFAAFRVKMAEEGLRESCINAFKHSYDKLARGETGIIRYATTRVRVRVGTMV